ncbi:MAG: D-alanyl-D-alanine carboxypeptidase [SAR324 cluster bacterium]|nr:D-alanyl-D-alanine carboxypeptidase [SAR324 cluster bacterium]
MKALFSGVCLCLILFQASISVTNAQELSPDPQSAIRRLVKGGTVVLASESGQSIFAINGAEQFVPASIVKLLTSLIALKELGPDYHFSTEIYQKNKTEFWVKGYGDPFLVSEEIIAIAQSLKKKGVTQITRLGLDASAFEKGLKVPGILGSSNPYDALNGALVVNFNSLNVKKDRQGRVTSGEKLTPLTPLALKKAKKLKRGFADRVNLAKSPEESLQYVGELFLAIFEKEGIKTTGAKIIYGKVKADELFYTHKNSKDLNEVLHGLLKYSNNFIANQIHLSLGMRAFGEPATLQKSHKIYQASMMEILGPRAKNIIVEEASGISRNNLMSGNEMLLILEAFRPHWKLLSHKVGVPLKSGTLTGVYNYAGYIETPKGIRPFVVMLNQKRNKRDSVVRLLKQIP